MHTSPRSRSTRRWRYWRQDGEGASKEDQSMKALWALLCDRNSWLNKVMWFVGVGSLFVYAAWALITGN